MKVSHASLPGSAAGNEDLVVAGPDAVVVLDGVSRWFGPESGCLHGTPWFVTELGEAIMRYVADPATALPAALEAAIGDVAALHAGTCDLRHPWTPAAAVAALRVTAGAVEFLVLGDCVIVLDTWTAIDVVTDDRLTELDRAARAPGAPHELREHLDDGFQRLRNRPGGYWIASALPAAARHAIGGTLPRTGVRSAALLTDGASRLVEPFRAGSWARLLAMLEDSGPEEVIAVVRQVEAADPDGRRWPRGKVHDDATAAFCLLV